MKNLMVFLVLVSSSAQAYDKVVCMDKGNFAGTYVLDIAGYESILDGTQDSMSKTLNFKRFRSFEQPVVEVSCTKPNAYLDGPGVVLACRSGAPANDYGPKGPTPFEVHIYQNQHGLEMTVMGPNEVYQANMYCIPSN